MVDARLPDGSRVNAIIPPLALKGPTLTIRKFSRDPYTMDDLINFGSISAKCAQFLAQCVRGKGEAYRPSGDEFVLVLPNHIATEAAAVAERIRHTVHAKPITSRSLTLSVSVGVAVFPTHATDLPALERAAAGKNRRLYR